MPHKLFPRPMITFKQPSYRACKHDAVLFLYAAHHHAHVSRLRHYHRPFWVEDLHQRIGNLRGHFFLYLEAAGVDFYESSELGDADYFFIGDVADAHFAEKWEHMVFAHRIKFDVFEHHHLIACTILKDRP